jgi:nucleoside-diphosphate-sugar epimerase
MLKTIVIGACGQIGTELVLKLREIKGAENVIAADLKVDCPEVLKGGPYCKIYHRISAHINIIFNLRLI